MIHYEIVKELRVEDVSRPLRRWWLVGRDTPQPGNNPWYDQRQLLFHCCLG